MIDVLKTYLFRIPFIKKKNSEWKKVEYPSKKNDRLPFIFLIFSISFGTWLLAQTLSLVMNFPYAYRSSFFRMLVDVLFLAIYGFFIFKMIMVFRRMKSRKKSIIANNLAYMIHTLKLYDEETFECENDFVFSYDGLPMIKSTIGRIIERYSKLAGQKRFKQRDCVILMLHILLINLTFPFLYYLNVWGIQVQKSL